MGISVEGDDWRETVDAVGVPQVAESSLFCGGHVAPAGFWHTHWSGCGCCLSDVGLSFFVGSFECKGLAQVGTCGVPENMRVINDCNSYPMGVA